MKEVLNKNNDFKKYKIDNIKGYKFKPRKKITNLNIINNKLINKILIKKITKEIKKSEITVKLIIESNVAIKEDCIMMNNEINRILLNIEKKYKEYFNEFEYFELIKKLYNLNMQINLKRKIIENNI